MRVTEKFAEGMIRARRRLFHFTDSRNLDSIRANGLLSTHEIRKRTIPAITGGDADSLGIDQHNGFDHYVRVSFCRSHPMSHVARERGSIQQLRILTICPTVLLREGVKFADRVATDNEAIIGLADEMVPQMDLTATYDYLDWKVPENQSRRAAAEKWEAMVPCPILVKDILGL
jgi:ssDNA thymidine ADP-ribosyltransferase, DarT